MKIAGEDYFTSDGRLTTSEAKSAPITPQAVMPKSLVFSPRIQFHETWPSGEYDRRGEIATCNRLTPLLAQQIKEELNNFKMVSEPGPRARRPLTIHPRKWRFTKLPRFIPISSEQLHSNGVVCTTFVSYSRNGLLVLPSEWRGILGFGI